MAKQEEYDSDNQEGLEVVMELLEGPKESKRPKGTVTKQRTT